VLNEIERDICVISVQTSGLENSRVRNEKFIDFW